MIDLLQRLVDNIVCFFQTALTLFVNVIITGIGFLWEEIVDLLPDMPGYPTPPSYIAEAISFSYYIADIGWIMTYLLTVFIPLFVVLLFIRIPMRWAKAAEE